MNAISSVADPAHELPGGDVLDAPDEELSPRIGLEP